jgi:hypothetical protein
MYLDPLLRELSLVIILNLLKIIEILEKLEVISSF